MLTDSSFQDASQQLNVLVFRVLGYCDSTVMTAPLLYNNCNSYLGLVTLEAVMWTIHEFNQKFSFRCKY